MPDRLGDSHWVTADPARTQDRIRRPGTPSWPAGRCLLPSPVAAAWPLPADAVPLHQAGAALCTDQAVTAAPGSTAGSNGLSTRHPADQTMGE